MANRNIWLGIPALGFVLMRCDNSNASNPIPILKGGETLTADTRSAFEALGAQRAHLSLSREKDYAVAVVAIE
jgi:phosphopantetheinyl transferase (holo-ACP synthase)